MSDVKNLILARKADAQKRIAQFRKAIDNAQVALQVAEEDLREVEQDEAEAQAAACREAEDARKPKMYHLAISDVDVNMLVTLLGYNMSIPELTAERGTDRYLHAARVVNNVRDSIAAQYYKYHGPSDID